MNIFQFCTLSVFDWWSHSFIVSRMALGSGVVLVALTILMWACPHLTTVVYCWTIFFLMYSFEETTMFQPTSTCINWSISAYSCCNVPSCRPTDVIKYSLGVAGNCPIECVSFFRFFIVDQDCDNFHWITHLTVYTLLGIFYVSNRKSLKED